MKKVEPKPERHDHCQSETNPQPGEDAEEPVPEISCQTLAALVGSGDEIPADHEENGHAWKVLKDQRPRGRIYFQVPQCVKIEDLSSSQNPKQVEIVQTESPALVVDTFQKLWMFGS